MSDNISRRSFVEAAGAVAGVAAVAGAVPAMASEAVMTPGVYVGEAKGHHGTLRVQVEVDQKSILSVEFIESVPRTNEVVTSVDLAVDPFAIYAYAMLDETPQVLDRVVDRLGQRIVDAQSTAVDAVVGATMTSLGYINAVRDALAQAGAPDDAFNDEPAKKTDELEYDGYDVIVVGGGCAGVTAAARATSLGSKVLLSLMGVSKTDRKKVVSDFEAILAKYKKELPAAIYGSLIRTETRRKLEQTRAFATARPF